MSTLACVEEKDCHALGLLLSSRHCMMQLKTFHFRTALATEIVRDFFQNAYFKDN